MEAERRAAQRAGRRRRVITGAVVAVVVIALLALVAALGGDDDGGEETEDAAATTTTTAPEKPEVTIPDTPPPTTLQSTDIEVGEGEEEVQTGDTLFVRYVGKIYATGEEFESTYEAPEPAEIQLTPGVIEGWSQGLQGMRVGGRRQLVIPPDLGYGAQPSGDIPANSTLVFVIDLVDLEKAPAPEGG